MNKLSSSSELLNAIENWFSAQCDDDWEHSWGLRIETIDNPGWRVEIVLVETAWAKVEIAFSRTERSESDWIHFKVHDGKFDGAGGVGNLAELLCCFLAVVQA